jgi:hypothetical protein
MIAAKQILRYLQSSKTLKLRYSTDRSISLIGYCGSDRGSNIDDRRSTSGHVFLINGTAVSWSSRKQPTVALPSTEAEHMALTHAAKEAIWIRQFLSDIGRPLQQPTLIWVDNQGCIALAKHHARRKHIDIQYHFVREQVGLSKIELEFVGTESMVADSLTKAISREKHVACHEGAGLHL